MNKNMTPTSGNGNGSGEPIAYKGIRVMTTERLAVEFGATPKQLQDNHANNRSRFVEGVHFFKIVGEELKGLKTDPIFSGQFDKRAPALMLWTERGTLNHAKILGTDETWIIHERLVDTYFAVKENRAALAIDLTNPDHLIPLLAQYAADKKALEEKVREQSPAVEALDRIAKSEGSLCLTDAAKDLQVRPKDLFAFMRQNGWIYHRPGKSGDIAYQDKIQQGYLEHKVTVVTRSDGTEKTVEQVRATPKGLARLAMVVPGARGPNGNHPAE